MVVVIDGVEMRVGYDEELRCKECGCSFPAEEISAEDDDGNDLCPACGSKHIAIVC